MDRRIIFQICLFLTTVLVYYFNIACCLYFIINYSWLIMDFGVDCILLIASDGFSEEHTVKYST